MEPLPSVNKAYSMILHVEKQRQVHNSLATGLENTAFLAKGGTGFKGNNKKAEGIKKSDLHCTHCNGSGHVRDNCFKLHGFPDWYKEMKDRKKG